MKKIKSQFCAFMMRNKDPHNGRLLFYYVNNKVYYIKKELHELGIITAKTSFGNEIKVYYVERNHLRYFKKQGKNRYSNSKKAFGEAVIKTSEHRGTQHIFDGQDRHNA